MNWNLLGNLFIAVFLVGPGALLLMRFLKGPRFPWWIVITLSLLVGSGCIVGASFSKTKDLEAQIHDYEVRGADVPDELMEKWSSDAHAVFALFFGWAFALLILCLWLIAYAIAHGVRRAIKKRALTPVPPADS